MLNHSSPENKIIEYLYQEMPEAEKEIWVPKFFEETSLHEEFNQMLDIKEQLDELTVSPSRSCIDKILSFAALS